MNNIRLKYLTKEPLQYGLNIEGKYYRDNGIRFLRTTDINDNGEIIGEGIYLDKNNVPKEYLLKKGDILFSRSGTIGRAYFHQTDEPITYAGFLVRFRLENVELAKWVYYYSKTPKFGQVLYSEAIESTIYNFNGQKYNNISIPLPPLAEQTAIAHYLDDKVEKIQVFIKNKKKIIALLKEQRQAVIHKAVTKGIKPNVSFKDSGIEWLGNIPEGWEVRRLKNCTSLNINSIPSNIDSKKYLKVALENIDNWTGKYIETENPDFEGQGNFFKKGDVLFNKLRPYLAKAYIAKEEGFSVGELLIFTPHKDYFTSDFLFQRLMTTDFIEVVNNSTYGAKMPRASWNFIGNLKLACPPLSEQLEIVTHIKTETKKIDASILKSEQEIALMSEYKEAMISEAVLGKMSINNKG